MATADEDRIAVRQSEAIRLRVNGASIREIAKELGISVGQAHADIKAVMSDTAKRTTEDADTERELELLRIDGALKIATSIAHGKLSLDTVDGVPLPESDVADLVSAHAELQLKAIDRIKALSSERSKLLGLHAPAKVESTVTSVTLEDLDARRAVADANTDDDNEGTGGAG